MIWSTEWPECFKASTKPGLKYVNLSILFTIHALPHKFKTADELRNNNSALFIGHLHYLGFSDATTLPLLKKKKIKTKQKVTSGITSNFSKMPQTRAPQFDKLPKRPVSNASYTYASQQSSHSLTIKILTVIIFFFFKVSLPSAFFPSTFIILLSHLLLRPSVTKQ